MRRPSNSNWPSLEGQFKAETEALSAATDPLTEKFESSSLKPTKSNITMKLVALAWAPYWQDGSGTQSACLGVIAGCICPH